MFRRRVSLKRCLSVLLLLCVCLFISLYATSSQGKHIILAGSAYYPTRTSINGLNPFVMPSNSTGTIMTELESFAGYKTISSCNGLAFPHELIAKDRWQKVDSENSAYVFSAYHEGNQVKIIGAVVMSAGSMTCQLWYKSDQSTTIQMITVPAAINRIPEGHGRRYTASIFTCQATQDQNSSSIIAVSLSKSACDEPLNAVPVVLKKLSGVVNKFTVCVTPFSNNYARAYELIEWIELNKLLGADKFIFYNYSSASNVERVLRSYSDIGLVEVVDWKLPMKVPSWPSNGVTEDIHYVGQMGSLNECLLRSKGRSEFLVNLDLDEFIIPREENVTTWEKMLDKMPTASSYLFANVFFRKEWNTSRTNFTGYADADKYHLVTLLRLQHEKQIWNYNQRSKYIVRPKDVNVLGIHNIWSQTGSSQNVPRGVALLHHYRNWMKYEDKQERIEDDIVARKFKDNLLRNVIDKWEALPGLVYDIPLCEKPRDFGAC